MNSLFLNFRGSIRDRHPLLWQNVRFIATIILHHFSRKRIRTILKRQPTIFLELGAGDRKGTNGWLTLDISGNADLYWDLMFGIPFPTESVAKVYSSHFFEHLSFNEIQKVLGECKRVLAPGGTFSICVPDARRYMDAYMTNAMLDEETNFIYMPGYNKTTKLDYVNYVAYMNGRHKYMFDKENLLFILQAKGFKNARLRWFDPTLDRQKYDFESIYAEAEK